MSQRQRLGGGCLGVKVVALKGGCGGRGLAAGASSWQRCHSLKMLGKEGQGLIHLKAKELLVLFMKNKIIRI